MKMAVFRRLDTADYAGTESLNTICSNLSFAGRNLKKIVLTSCVMAEGKSYMSVQIMQNLAKRGKRVALVDADLRRSFLVSRYNIEMGTDAMGLAHYLAGYCSMEDAIYETNLAGACFVPAGRDVANPIPLLDSPYFSAFLDYLAERFDIVLVDAPPVGMVIDAAEIAGNCDGVIFVVEYNQTRRRDLAEAQWQIEQAGCMILGCIINKVSSKGLSGKKYYNKLYYGQYNNEYYRKRSADKAREENKKAPYVR